jgi:L-asparaginase
MKRIVVITTDGAIAIKDSPMVGGAVPSLKGNEFLSLLPRDGITIAFEEFSNLPSSHIIPARGLELAQRVESALMAPDADGVVVTHGTDTLEETAYLLDLTVNTSKPVVVTGAMRTANSPGYDGIANLSNAIRVAAAAEARDMGVLVVFGDEIHAASEVQCVYTQATNAFQSPGSGPLGYLDAKQILLRHRPTVRQYIPCSRMVETVDLIRLTQGADDRLIRHSIADGVAGIVLETFGSGRVPPWWLPFISEAIAGRVVVAATSRCLIGSLGDDYGYVGAYHDLLRLGVLMVHNLNGTKARIKLMAALGAARSSDELRRWFQ